MTQKKYPFFTFVNILIGTDLKLIPSHFLLEKFQGRTGLVAIKVHFGKKAKVVCLGKAGPDNCSFQSLRPE